MGAGCYAIVGTLLLPHGGSQRGALLVDDGRISAVLPPSAPLPVTHTLLDWSAYTIIPGLIDLQLNGAFGDDFMRDPASVRRVAPLLLRHGVTSFLPTLISSPLSTLHAGAHAIAEAMRAGSGEQPAAHILGTHLEGPFLNADLRGAHNPLHTRPAQIDEIAPYVDAPQVRLITLAPELENAHHLIAAARQRGIVVSVGHTGATYDEAMAAFDAGARLCTHLFNAMVPVHHRRPGVIVAGLTHPDVVVGAICDGMHIHPAVMQMIWRAKGTRGVCLVTDAMQALGQPPGRYILADRMVVVDEQVARLADSPDGQTFAGSILRMDVALRNTMAFTGCSLADAVTMASTVPADLLGVRKGRLQAGADADIVALDAALTVRGVLVGGRLAAIADE